MSPDSSSTPHDDERYLAKELSWLAFNERVLQEAADITVPPIQRLRYLGIFSNNLDEFFRVRVAEVRRLASFSSGAEQSRYKTLLETIQKRVIELQIHFELIYINALNTLRKHKIYLINEHQLDEKQSHYVKQYFQKYVQPELMPQLLDEHHPIPELTDASIYLAIKLHCKDQIRYALLEVPTERLSRFIAIPQLKGKRGRVYIVLENIIRHCLHKVFRNLFAIEHAEAYTIKLTRDAELEMGDGVTQGLMEKMSSSLKKRHRGDPVRFVYDEEMPEDLLGFLHKRLSLGRYDSLIPGSRYHNSKDFMNFPTDGPKFLDLAPMPALPVPALHEHANLFECIRQQDVLLYYPYHSFEYIVDLLKTAAIDPATRSITISLYRVAKNSHIVDALVNAARNHKDVSAVVELKARFDEQANIEWAKRLTENGVKVIFGTPDLKVHAKMILIGRMENNALHYYTHIGTGNFNEKTSTLYTDFSLLTCNQEIGKEIAKVFDFVQHTYKHHNFKKLGVSPHTNRPQLLRLLNREIDNARAGKKAAILFKCNNLVDSEIIDKLYEASQAGVKIRLIIRGMCALIPGKPGLSDNIEAISIVDRFLEHARVYVFHNDGAPIYIISSGDIMTRNLDYRVEVSAPVEDKKLQKMLRNILDLQWHDNIKARIIDAQQSNSYRPLKKTLRIRSQEAIYQYLGTGKMPRLPKDKKLSGKNRKKNQ